MGFAIASLQASNGEIGICPVPGRFGDYAADLAVILEWRPRLVLTMTEAQELARIGASGLAEDLEAEGIGWEHLPIRDFGAPNGETLAKWPETAMQAKAVLRDGGRVLVHCFGGCGRSGMAILRLLVEMGEQPEEALQRLRAVRPCAVETDAQFDWAANRG